MNAVRERNPDELEFQQAVQEVVESVLPYTLDHPLDRTRVACVFIRRLRKVGSRHGSSETV